MLKVNKQVLIDFIISCLEKGDKRSAILAKVGEEWQEKVSERTFDRALKTANEQQKERLEKARKAADEVYIENNVNAVKTVLKSKIEKQAELQLSLIHI